jgi:hypothetical protein
LVESCGQKYNDFAAINATLNVVYGQEILQ